MNDDPKAGPPNALYKGFSALVTEGVAPYFWIFLNLAVGVFFALHVPQFKMDASSDSIVLENDVDMKYYVETSEKYGADEFLALMVTPKDDLFAPATLEKLKALTEEIAKDDMVASVMSILRAPLFHSPPVALMQVASGYKTLESPNMDPFRELARKELVESPLFGEFLIGKDGRTTIVQINFKPDPEYNQMYFDRFNLREKRRLGTITPEETVELERVTAEYRQRYREVTTSRRAFIERLREMKKNHEDWAELRLGGVPMVVADIVKYVERDIVVFGIAVLAFVLGMVAAIFRKPRLMYLPFLTCLLALICMMGYLGLVDWRTTIVTANFSSLLLIITTENAILLASNWRERGWSDAISTPRELSAASAASVVGPCFYSTLTTMVGFASLIVSGIRPVMDFGLMMTYGLGASFLICFTFMPAVLALYKREKAPAGAAPRVAEEDRASNVSVLARIAEFRPGVVLVVTLLAFGFFGFGLSRLTVENRFMDYFRKSTEVYRGMVVIDEKLGGTMPLDIVIKGDGPDFWMDPANLAKLRELHSWLDDLPETGKVISLDTLVRVLEGINKGQPVNKFILNLVRKNLPEEMQRDILSPYVNADFSEVRVSIRMRETMEGMKRADVLERIRDRAANASGFAPENVNVNGMFVLYNNMLESLFGSQIKTVGTVLVTVFLTFSLVFRSFRLALLGMIPNILSVTTILGLIGWLGIPLDMMTIMIAAITFGLADDNTIHYIHRFQEEFRRDGDYRATMYRCHNTIGRALSYSMLTIVVGFSILTASSFLPTVYFGIFTGVAMMLALTASHTVLPVLILYFKPLGAGRKAEG